MRIAPTPCNHSRREEPELSASAAGSEGSWASRHHAPPADTWRKSTQRDEHSIKETGSCESKLNNKNITWCTECQLHSGRIKPSVYEQGKEDARETRSGQLNAP